MMAIDTTFPANVMLVASALPNGFAQASPRGVAQAAVRARCQEALVPRFGFRRYLVVLKVVTAMMSCALLTSCYSPNVPELQQEINNIAKVGMPSYLAVSRLGAAGFECMGSKGIECSRIKQAFFAGCKQGVNIAIDGDSLDIARVDTPFINCASF